MLTKYAQLEEILEVKEAKDRLDLGWGQQPGEGLSKFAKTKDVGEVQDGYLYVRARAISSRVNKNNDGWPSEELARAYKTFIGRPIFVDHNNTDPRRTRGVVVDAQLHRETDKTSSLDPYYSNAPENHKPATWVEILMEVDAKTFPKLADAIRNGDIDATSMGANIDRSICSVCANEATVPSEYCEHISSGKGTTFEIVADNGEKLQKTAYEDCYGVNFFEDSFVFDPADPTADILGKEGHVMQKGAPYPENSYKNAPDHTPKKQKHKWPAEVNAVYNACMREDRGSGSTKEEKESSCAAIAQAQYKKTKNKKSAVEEFIVLDPEEVQAVEDLKYAHLMRLADEDRQLNTVPQEEQVKAPQKVDTLQDDIPCPNCEADELATDPDGVMKCPTCGYEQPPEGLDNPDLSRAKDFDQEQRETEERDSEGNKSTPVAPVKPTTEDFIAPIAPVGQPTSATNKDVTTEGINEMIWKREIKTNDAVAAKTVLASLVKKAESVDAVLGHPLGVHNEVHGEMKAIGASATVTYPQELVAQMPPKMIEVMGKDGLPPNVSRVPGNAMKDMYLKQLAVKTLGLTDASEVPVHIDGDASTLLSIVHNGGKLPEGGQAPTAATKNGPVNKQVVLPNGRKTDEPKDEKIVSDQLKPVEADRRVIKREEHPDGRRTEQIVEETEADFSIKEDAPEEPEAKEEKPKENEEETSEEDGDEDKRPDFLKKKDKEPVAANLGEKKLLAAFQLADEAVEMGIIQKEQKHAFIAQLESESLDKIQARRATIEMVRSAGLERRKLRPSTAKRIPRLASTGGEHTSSNSLDDIPIEAIFFN